MLYQTRGVYKNKMAHFIPVNQKMEIQNLSLSPKQRYLIEIAEC